MPRKKEQTIDAYIGARVRLRRLMLGMSQESLGGQLSLTFQQIQKYEKGVNRISASRLYALARALSVPVNYFFEGLSNPDLPSDYDSLQEANTVSPLFGFRFQW